MVHSRGELPVEIRGVEERDRAALLELYRAAFPKSAQRPADEVDRKLGALFFDGPLRSSEMPSVGAFDEGGRLVGFHGILARRWRLDDELLTGRTGTHNMVHPDAQRMGVNAKLMVAQRAHRNALGRPFVGYSDRGTDDSRQFHDGWNNPSGQHHRLEQLGFRYELTRRGRVRETLSALRGRGGADAGAPAALRERPLDAVALCEAFDALGADFPVRLDEPVETARWLLEYLADYPSRGRFHSTLLCAEGGAPVGFACGYLKEGWLEVVALGVLREQQAAALASLVRAAAELDAHTVSGWANAAELRGVMAAGAAILPGKRGGVTTTHEGVRLHFQAMSALVTGLEGERWL